MSRKSLLTTLTGSLCVFLVARLTVADPLTNNINTLLWQLTAPAWIADKSLWSTVLSFHAQPPGLIALQWAETNLAPGIIGFSMLLAAAVFVCCCGCIAAIVTKHPVVGLITATVIAFQPETLLYSHWFFSSIYLAALVSLNLLLLFGWARTGNAAWLGWAVFALAVASLFHAAYSVVVFAVVGLMLLYTPIRRFDLRRPVLIVPLIIATSIALFAPVKNFTLFGFFSASSWARLNIANVYANDRLIWQKCASRVRVSKRPTGDYGTSMPDTSFRESLNRDMLFQPVKPRGGVNLNHLDVMNCAGDVRFAEQFNAASAALNIVRAFSEAIALPAWDYHWLGEGNLKKIASLVKLYELNVTRADKVEFRYYVDIQKRPDNWLESLPSLTSLILSVTVFFACVTLLVEFAQAWRHHSGTRDGGTTRQHLARIYPCVLALLILAIFVFASGQELNRVKFSLTPLFIASVLEALRCCAASEAPAWLRRLLPLHSTRKAH